MLTVHRVKHAVVIARCWQSQARIISTFEVTPLRYDAGASPSSTRSSRTSTTLRQVAVSHSETAILMANLHLIGSTLKAI